LVAPQQNTILTMKNKPTKKTGRRKGGFSVPKRHSKDKYRY